MSPSLLKCIEEAVLKNSCFAKKRVGLHQFFATKLGRLQQVDKYTLHKHLAHASTGKCMQIYANKHARSEPFNEFALPLLARERRW